MMHIERLSKDEMLSHIGELVSTQDKQIKELTQQRRALIALASAIVIFSVL